MVDGPAVVLETQSVSPCGKPRRPRGRWALFSRRWPSALRRQVRHLACDEREPTHAGLNPASGVGGVRPIPEELQAVLHLFGGPGSDQVEQTPHLLPYAVALLLADHDARVVPSAPEETSVERTEMPGVEGVYHATLLRGVREEFMVLTSNQPRLVRGLEVHTARAKRLDQVSVHRVFVEVEAYFHRCAFVCAGVAWCSRYKRSCSASSAAICASIAA